MRVAKWSRSQIGCISRGVRVVSAGARQALACWWHVCACRAPADAGRARRNASYLRTGPLSDLLDARRGLALVDEVEHGRLDRRVVRGERAGLHRVLEQAAVERQPG